MLNVELVHVYRYYPLGVSEIISRGGESFIRVLNEFTVLKYLYIPGNNESIQTETQLLKIAGSYPRIIILRDITVYRLILQCALNRSLNDYITIQPDISIARRLLQCKQAAEAVSFIHGKYIIYYDINLWNFLLDYNLSLFLADFQGMLKSIDGRVILDGFSWECSKLYMSRPYGDYANVITDIFALGSAIYFIIMLHEIFLELDSLEDDERILSCF